MHFRTKSARFGAPKRRPGAQTDRRLQSTWTVPAPRGHGARADQRTWPPEAWHGAERASAQRARRPPCGGRAKRAGAAAALLCRHGRRHFEAEAMDGEGRVLGTEDYF